MTSVAEPIALACAADANYAMPLAVTIRSVVSNLNSFREIVLFVLDGGIKQAQKQKIIASIGSKVTDVKWIEPSKTALEKLEVSEKYPVSTYFRLLLPQILPQHLKKIIYLDTDLVVNGDLAQLWNIDVETNYVLAAQDAGYFNLSNVLHLKDCEKLEGLLNCKYFNTGVLVINLEKWRTDKIAEETIQFLENNPQHILFADQDALNVVLAGKKWGELDPRWNQVHSIYQYSSWQDSPFEEEVFHNVLNDPYVIHFTTPPKPWQNGCHHPKKDLFFQYLDQTAWSGWRNTIWRRIWRRFMKEASQFRVLNSQLPA
jgi:lipopolysaccharide biosynthesis glycosyltransferase